MEAHFFAQGIVFDSQVFSLSADQRENPGGKSQQYILGTMKGVIPTPYTLPNLSPFKLEFQVEYHEYQT